MNDDLASVKRVITRQCDYCKSEVLEGATRCPNCQSFLGLTGKIRNATAELAIVSLSVSIIALSLPLIQTSLLPQHSNLIVSVLRPNESKFEFVISNNGNRTAAITEAGLEFSTTYKGKKLNNWVLLDNATYRAILIEPEKSYRFASEISSGLPPLQPNPGVETEAPALLKKLPEDCTLKVVYIDFDGSEKIARKPYRCFAPG